MNARISPVDIEFAQDVAVARAPSVGYQPHHSLLRSSEWVLVVYFSYIAVLAACWQLPLSTVALAASVPAVLTVLAYAESRRGNKATGVLREWIVPALVLVAYREIDWFRPLYRSHALEHRWVFLDRLLLDQWHAHATIESLGFVIPWTLELFYFLMYAIPPLSLLVLYRMHQRSRVDKFLFTFLIGTLTTYALLPFFPCEAPRFVFAGEDLPQFNTVFRTLNVWLLDHCDIRTSVFPSGHVTAAFSAAFGMLLAFPEKKRVGAVLLIAAAAIAITTVYGRYHYVVDGIAGLFISVAAAGISAAFFAVRRRKAQRELVSVADA
jgi:membrane-associated phospholipid phosphatase